MIRLPQHSTATRCTARQLQCSWMASRSRRVNSIVLKSAASNQRRDFSFATMLRSKVDILVPQMPESISDGTLTTMFKQVGDMVEADDEVASIETDKVDLAVNADEPGRIIEVHVAENDTVEVGQRIATMATGDDAGGATETPQPKSKPEQPLSQPTTTSAETPSEAPSEQPPKSDLVPEATPSPTTSRQPSPPSPDRTAPSPAEPEQTVPPSHSLQRRERPEKMPRIRQTIARRLKESQNRTASLTTVQTIDMSALKQLRSDMKKQGVRLGYTSVFTKAATLAAQEVPQINAAMDIDNEVIIYRDYVDVSIAVSTDKGLVTPVLRNTESMDIMEIERNIAAMAEKARKNKLTLEDITGGNFSISNPGIFGSMFGTPLINYPQSAVFNINSIKDEPVVVGGQIVIRPLMFVTLTYDHRLIDGREAVTFLNKVKGYAENPASMLFASRQLD